MSTVWSSGSDLRFHPSNFFGQLTLACDFITAEHEHSDDDFYFLNNMRSTLFTNQESRIVGQSSGTVVLSSVEILAEMISSLFIKTELSLSLNPVDVWHAA